jgi:hypothetical protein
MEDNERMRVWLQNIVDVYDARSELFTSEAECAASMADRARAALAGKVYSIKPLTAPLPGVP